MALFNEALLARFHLSIHIPADKKFTTKTEASAHIAQTPQPFNHFGILLIRIFSLACISGI